MDGTELDQSASPNLLLSNGRSLKTETKLISDSRTQKPQGSLVRLYPVPIKLDLKLEKI